MPFKPVSERMGEALGKRPQRSPTPPPKPNFGLQGKTPHSPQQQPRVVNIPIRIERTDESDRANSPTASSTSRDQPKANSTLPGSLSLSSSSSPAHPISHPVNQSPGPHVVNIPIHMENSQSEGDCGNGTSTSKPSANSGKQSKQTAANDPIVLIKEIDSETEKLEGEVGQFNGEYLDKEYRYLDEMLTRSMLKLDNIESNGREDVRAARKSSLARIDKCIRDLETKANKSQQPQPINEGDQEPSSSQEAPTSIHSKPTDQEPTNIDEDTNEDTNEGEGNDNDPKMDVEGVC